MNKICSDELKKIEIDILLYIHSICEDNGLNYSLYAGTLIGAVRHKGFIPWDDDIDICMPKSDYLKFKELMKKSDRYKFLDMDSEGYLYTFGKVVDPKTKLVENATINNSPELGVYVDVFPLEELPQKNTKQLYRKLRNIQKEFWWELFGSPRKGKYIVLYLINKLRAYYNHRNCMKNVKLKYAKYTSHEPTCEYNMVGVVGGAYGEREIFPKEYFENFIFCTFEGHDFYISEKYDKILTQMYGDYMVLPPLEKQITVHNFTAYYK